MYIVSTYIYLVHIVKYLSRVSSYLQFFPTNIAICHDRIFLLYNVQFFPFTITLGVYISSRSDITLFNYYFSIFTLTFYFVKCVATPLA